MTRAVRTTRQPRRSPLQIFAWPLVILLASLAGLVLGLLGTGWRDALACLLLVAGPLAAALLLFNQSHIKDFR